MLCRRSYWIFGGYFATMASSPLLATLVLMYFHLQAF
jgi:hypothetical protein